MTVRKESTIHKYIGLASDTKPTSVPAGTTYFAYDTKALYVTYDGTNYVIKGQGVEQSVEKTDGAVLNGADDLFTIAGAPVLVTEFVGIVTTDIGGVANCQIKLVVTEPAGTVTLSTDVAITSDAAGTSYTFSVADPAVLTPTTAGGLLVIPRIAWLCPIGTINATCSAVRTGNIKWYMMYKPLSPNSIVSPSA